MTTILELMLSKVGLRMKATAPSRPESLYADFGGASIESLADNWTQRKLERQAIQCSWVYSDVGLLGRKMAQPALNVLRVKGEGTEHVYDHDFERLMRRPNPLMSGSFLRSYTAWWYCIDGNAYWWLGYVGEGEKKELLEIWPLPARDVTPVRMKKKQGEDGDKTTDVLVGYKFRTSTGEKLYPADMICHFKTVNPYDPFVGLSPLTALRAEVQGDTAMKEWNLNFFGKKNAIPTVIISLPQHTQPNDFKRIREQLQKEFGGTKRNAMITRAGQIKVESVGLSQRDMEFLAGIELNRETVDRVFGIPAGYWAKDANRNTSATAELIFTRDTVQPTLDYFAEEIDAQVIDPFYEDDLTVAYDSVVPEDRELKVEEFKAYSPVLTVDENRQRLDAEALGGELGGTLYGLLPALGQMMAGGGEQMALPEEQEVSKATAELRTWRKVALKEVARGKDPGARDFVSDAIPDSVREVIQMDLDRLDSAAEVRAVFDDWLAVTDDWADYP